jgi:hypothetical protein
LKRFLKTLLLWPMYPLIQLQLDRGPQICGVCSREAWTANWCVR